VVPNKTIYVSDGDLALFQRAQEIVGGNLSAAIVRALRRMVEVEDARMEGFEEITVSVGAGQGRRQRFFGVLLADWARSTKDRVEQFHVYRSRTGKYVLHIERSAEAHWSAGPDGSATGLRKYFSSNQQWGTTPPIATLEILDTIDELRERVPHELFDMVVTADQQPSVEDLDI
jgi:EXLDI family protein